MGSLFEELQAREAAVRPRVEGLGAEISELTVQLEAGRERLSRLVITRETVAELAAEGVPELEPAGASGANAVEAVVLPFAGAETRVVGVLTVPRWQPGLAADVLPRAYRDVDAVRGGEAGGVQQEGDDGQALARVYDGVSGHDGVTCVYRRA